MSFIVRDAMLNCGGPILMGKRFTDTDKWDRPWFRMLPDRYKLFWQFLLDRCDVAGVWYVDVEIASFYLGSEIDRDMAERLFDKQIEVKGDKWLVKDFVSFQYGNFSPSNKLFGNVSAKLKLFKDANQDGASIPHMVVPDGAKDKDKDKVKERGAGGKQTFTKPTIEEVRDYCKERGMGVDADRWFAYYESNGWMVGRNKMKNWKFAVITWEKNNYGKQFSNISNPIFQPPTPPDPDKLAAKREEMEKLRDREYAKRLKAGETKKNEQPPWPPPFDLLKLKTGDDIKDMPNS